MPNRQISSARVSRQDRLRLQKDAAAKARTLKRYGLANFRGSLSAASMTPKRAKRANALFDAVQKETQQFVKGKTERAFYRPDPHKDYQLNTKFFRFLKSKNPVPTQENVLKTDKGNIVSTTDPNAQVVGVSKDGTIELRQGDLQIFTGRMTDKQTLAFVRQVDNGTFKFPKEYRIGITYFQNNTGERIYYNLREMQRDLRHYAPKVDASINAQYPNFETLKVTYYKLTEREIAQNAKLERKRESDRKYREKKKQEKGTKKKGRRFRSRN